MPRLVLLHRAADLHVYAVPDALDEDAHLWPGVGPARVELVEAVPVPRPAGIAARQVLDQLAWPVGTPEAVLWHRLVHRQGRYSGLWVEEVVRPGWWRVRSVHALRDVAVEWGLWAVVRRLGEGGR